MTWSRGLNRHYILMFSERAFINEMRSEVELTLVARLMKAVIALIWVTEHHYGLHQVIKIQVLYYWLIYLGFICSCRVHTNSTEFIWKICILKSSCNELGLLPAVSYFIWLIIDLVQYSPVWWNEYRCLTSGWINTISPVIMHVFSTGKSWDSEKMNVFVG